MSEPLRNQQTRLPLANLIIAGVNRSATTSIFTYLSEHPQICPSTIKETNYFLPVMKGGVLEPIEAYAAYFKCSENMKYRMEASPPYIFGGVRVAKTIYGCLGPIRIIFVLRDPVTRMVSYFYQMKRKGEVPVGMSVDEYAQRALTELPAVLAMSAGKPIDVYRESIFTRGLAQGFYVDYLEEWYEVFPATIHVNFFEHVSRNPHFAVQELCSWLGLDISVYEGVAFTQENRSMGHKNTALFKIASRINDRFEPFWRKHKYAKRWIREIYLRLNEEHSGNPPLSQSMRTDLERVYAFRNQKLWAMLYQRGYRDFPRWLAGSLEDETSK